MSLRTRLITVLVVSHVVFLVASGFSLWGRGPWLLAVEAVFVTSLVVSLRLALRGLEPLALLRDAADAIRESDYTTRYRRTGQSDVDTLVDVYNTMTDNLREERIRTQEQENLLQRIEEHAPIGMIVLDHDGNVARANPAARKLVEPALGEPLAASSHALGQRLASMRDGDESVLPVDGRRRLRARRLAFVDRGFPRSFFLVDELTDELRRSEKAAYEKLIRMMAHEVNNTVGSVNSLLDSVRSLTADDPAMARAHEALEIAIRRGDSMNAFMRGLADVVRVGRPSRTEVDTGALLADLHRLFEAELQRRRIAWTVEDGGGPGVVSVDRGQIEHALSNVVRNAIDSIGEDGTVRIRTVRTASAWELEIEDDGEGIDAEAAESLFTPFFTTKSDGQGIGLMLVQEILLGHGADFGLRPGVKGATFWVRVPRG